VNKRANDNAFYEAGRHIGLQTRTLLNRIAHNPILFLVPKAPPLQKGKAVNVLGVNLPNFVELYVLDGAREEMRTPFEYVPEFQPIEYHTDTGCPSGENLPMMECLCGRSEAHRTNEPIVQSLLIYFEGFPVISVHPMVIG
jgi:hypothetical protein